MCYDLNYQDRVSRMAKKVIANIKLQIKAGKATLPHRSVLPSVSMA